MSPHGVSARPVQLSPLLPEELLTEARAYRTQVLVQAPGPEVTPGRTSLQTAPVSSSAGRTRQPPGHHAASWSQAPGLHCAL